MRVTREIGFFSLLVLVTLFVQNAGAALLPFSTFGDREGWQGRRDYGPINLFGRVLSGHVDFTVYDTTNLELPGETALGAEWEKPGKYIYAYQIWNGGGVLNEEVLYFAVFNKTSGVPLDVDFKNISSIEDTSPSGSGVEPTGVDLTVDHLEVIWKFQGEAPGEAILLAGDHSWFLMFSSDSSPVVGDFRIESSELPSTHAPEPATIALLGIGGALMFTKRRKSAQ